MEKAVKLLVADPKLIAQMQSDISEIKQALQKLDNKPQHEFLTAQEFIDAIKGSRWKFDELVRLGLIKTKKIGRKFFVPISEVDRYFNGEMKLHQ